MIIPLQEKVTNNMFSKRNKHGGVRKGAGKPAQFEKPMKRKEVMLPDEAIEFFLALGEGNLSAGIRMAWRSLTQRAADASPESPLKNKRQVAKRR